MFFALPRVLHGRGARRSGFATAGLGRSTLLRCREPRLIRAFEGAYELLQTLCNSAENSILLHARHRTYAPASTIVGIRSRRLTDCDTCGFVASENEKVSCRFVSKCTPNPPGTLIED